MAVSNVKSIVKSLRFLKLSSDKVECSQPIRIVHSLGQRDPVHCTGAGKTLFSGVMNEENDRVIAERGLRSYTLYTITNRDQLFQEIERVRKEEGGSGFRQ
ncbi:MAG: IclR family transcriptional regulator C-terminal domain-containing protein [Deltaproteobacteria bacterium]